MEFDKVIRKRTATRSFKSDEVSDSKMSKILEAGRVAPTAKNKQPQLILVAKSKEALEKIDKLTNFRYNAPVVLTIGYKTDDYLESPMHNVRKELEEMVRYV